MELNLRKKDVRTQKDHPQHTGVVPPREFGSIHGGGRISSAIPCPAITFLRGFRAQYSPLSRFKLDARDLGPGIFLQSANPRLWPAGSKGLPIDILRTNPRIP